MKEKGDKKWKMQVFRIRKFKVTNGNGYQV
jgi:hypothetical protein